MCHLLVVHAPHKDGKASPEQTLHQCGKPGQGTSCKDLTIEHARGPVPEAKPEKSLSKALVVHHEKEPEPKRKSFDSVGIKLHWRGPEIFLMNSETDKARKKQRDREAKDGSFGMPLQLPSRRRRFPLPEAPTPPRLEHSNARDQYYTNTASAGSASQAPSVSRYYTTDSDPGYKIVHSVEHKSRGVPARLSDSEISSTTASYNQEKTSSRSRPLVPRLNTGAYMGTSASSSYAPAPHSPTPSRSTVPSSHIINPGLSHGARVLKDRLSGSYRDSALGTSVHSPVSASSPAVQEDPFYQQYLLSRGSLREQARRELRKDEEDGKGKQEDDHRADALSALEGRAEDHNRGLGISFNDRYGYYEDGAGSSRHHRSRQGSDRDSVYSGADHGSGSDKSGHGRRRRRSKKSTTGRSERHLGDPDDTASTMKRRLSDAHRYMGVRGEGSTGTGR